MNDRNDSNLRHLFPHGGSRRKTGERSDTLSLDQCRMILRASARAMESGKRFNRFITILWERSGVDEGSATNKTRSFIKLASDWMRLRRKRLTWVYVHEWGQINGAHAHILLHVPPYLDSEFRPMPKRWVKNLLPNEVYIPKTVQSKKIAGANAPDDVSREIYEHALRARLHYICKSAAPELMETLGMCSWAHHEWGQRGRIIGKRAGCWQERNGGPNPRI